MKDEYKPKILKNTKIEYDGNIYDKILSLNRSYDYAYFDYIDDSGSRVSVSLQQGKDFNIINTKS